MNCTEEVGITHNTSTARTPQQNGVVKRRNCTLVNAARTMLIFSKSLLFLWPEAVATACYTQNRSLIHTRYNKTPYELLRGSKPELKYLHIFGALCYLTNDFEDLGKLQSKADIGIFIGIQTEHLPLSTPPRLHSLPTPPLTESISKLVYGVFYASLAKASEVNYKEVMEESCWIETMQEEIYEFERLEGIALGKSFIEMGEPNTGAGRPAVASRGGGTGGRAGSGCGRTRGRSGDQGDVLDFSIIIAQQLQNLLPTIVAQGDASRGCTYKEFLACNPKEYNGKGGAIVYTHWIKKMELVQDMSRCRDNQKVKYTAGSFVGMSWEDFKTLTREEFCPSNEMQKLETELWNYAMVGAGHAAYTNRFHELARLVPHLVTPEGKRIRRYIAGTLTDEALRNWSIKKNPEKRGNEGEPSKDRNVRDDNKRTRTGNAFATTTNPIGRENTGTVPKCNICNTHHMPEAPCRTCFNCNRPGHFAKDCRLAPRDVNPINARNPIARAYYECGSTDHIRSAYPRMNQAQRPRGNHQNQVVAVNGGQGHGN
ncbi:reverse transcriptase domain-containing protein [Tanacetum coccineum]